MTTLKIRSNLRPVFVYASTLTATGKLKYIKAGCRTWRSWESAFRHYHGERGIYKWTDAHLAQVPEQDLFGRNPQFRERAIRFEARQILKLLADRTHRMQKAIATQRRRRK